MTFCGWDGCSRSGVALAMRHRLSGLSTYGFKGLKKEMSTSPTPLCGMAPVRIQWIVDTGRIYLLQTVFNIQKIESCGDL